MNNNRKRLLITCGTAAMVVAATAIWINRRLFLVNDVTTGESEAYPQLRSRVYYSDIAHALSVTEQSIRSLPRWRVVHVDGEDAAVQAEVETVIGGFIDDVSITIRDISHGQVRVTIRSRSREGKGDLGQNALHIRDLQEAMDRRLTEKAAF